MSEALMPSEMRVGLITDDIDDENTGVANYARSLAGALAELVDGPRVTLIHRRDHEFYENREHLKLVSWGPRPHTSTEGAWNRFVRKQALMPLLLRGRGFDVVHDTNHYAPFLPPSAYGRVITIYDLIPLIIPEPLWRRRLDHMTLIRLIARRADRIVTLSECSKRDIVRLYGIDERRITAISLAADERFRPASAAEIRQARAAHDLPGRYFLHVGAFEARKNLVPLIDAFCSAAQDMSNVSLVTMGRLGPGDQQRLTELVPLNLRGRVRALGRVDDKHLASLYSGAEALVYPSAYEGFGLPVLEAMQCGTPVITSSLSSLPEVVGDAALTVDPRDKEEMARALVQLAGSRKLRGQLREFGLRRAQLFSWRETAQQTLQVYQEVSAQRRAKKAV